MPKMLTGDFMRRTFFLPFSLDKSEGVWARPMSLTKRMELQREAQMEAGMDADLSGNYLCRRVLQESIIDWQGFSAPDGTEIPYSKEAVAGLCEHDPAMASELLTRILAMARAGELAERKN